MLPKRFLRRGWITRTALSGVLMLLAARASAADESVIAETKPRWELGVGVAPLTVPAYPGASEQRYFLFPLPIVIYRSDWLRVDRDGATGFLWNSDRAELDISFDGAVPVEASEDGPREEMDELDPLVEVGPSLNIDLAKWDERSLELQLPVRAAISVDSSRVARQGWKFHPQLQYEVHNGVGGWDIGLSVGPKFSTQGLHGYYYDVPPGDARLDRPAFDASGGYSGVSTIASASRRFDDFWLGSFVRYENLSEARFEDSPLVETEHAVSAGFIVTWLLWRSEEQVIVERGAGGAGIQ